jgi:hypothetical protein
MKGITHMNPFVCTKKLKSIYIVLFALYVLTNSPQTLVWLGFQRVYEGAHLFFVNWPVRKPFFTKGFISLCLGNFGMKITLAVLDTKRGKVRTTNQGDKSNVTPADFLGL